MNGGRRLKRKGEESRDCERRYEGRDCERMYEGRDCERRYEGKRR